MDISLILPTRKRTRRLTTMLRSVVERALCPQRIEAVLYVDFDDLESREFEFSDLAVRKIVGPRCSMGLMTRRCYEATRGRVVMLANDDVCFGTDRWDERVLSATLSWPDGLGLVWGNDGCTGAPAHPFLSRTTCDLLGSICPEIYLRWYIEVHIYDVFRRLKRFGHDRLCYLPDVLVEHLHVENGKAEADETYVNPHRGADELSYITWAEERQRLAVRLARRVEAGLRAGSGGSNRQRLGRRDDLPPSDSRSLAPVERSAA
jgi:hypothetical protein